MKKNLLGLSLAAAALATGLGVFAVGADSPAKAAGSAPTALKAQVKADGVRLSWAGPVDIYNKQRVTESFETYEVNADQFGAWGNEDLDGINLSANRINLTTGKNQPAGWYVTTEGTSSYRVPSDGSNMVAVSGVSGTANDWLISPLLADVESQYVSFTHRKTSSATETFEVLASTTDSNIDSFELVKAFEDSYYGTGYAEQEFITLPAGAKYFAIRYTSDGGAGLLIDEISYIPAQAAVVAAEEPVIEAPDLTAQLPVSYNVYRNGEMIASVDGVTYLDETLAAGDYNYQVSAVYAEGESRLTPAARVTITDTDVVAPAPAGLTGTYETDGAHLQWDTPISSVCNTTPYTEDFEGDAPYDIISARVGMCSNWMVFNAGQDTYKTKNSNAYRYGWYLLTGNGHNSSNQSLATCTSNSTFTADHKNVWAISPRLAPVTQSVNFFARVSNSTSQKAFRVYATTSDDPLDLSSYTPITDELTPVYNSSTAKTWNEYNVALPAGTTYFAFRNCSETVDNTLRIDDVTYIPETLPETAAASRMRVLAPRLGYNIYRNGEKVNDAPVADTNYVDDADAIDGATNAYTVTAVYAGGLESEPSDPFVLVAPRDPAPYDLAAAIDPAGVKLTWVKPDLTLANATPETWTFNGYTNSKIIDDPDHEGFSDIGPWTIIQRTAGERSNVNHGNGYAWYLNSGEIRAYGLKGDEPANDWLISEELSGRHQDIAIQANSSVSSTSTNHSLFAVYYTMSDDRYDLDSYVKSGEFIPEMSKTVHLARVPYGARYFAIVNCNPGTSNLIISAITYIPAHDGDAPAHVLAKFNGYNIYRDGQKINAEPVADTEYLDTTVDDGTTYKYTVKAIFGARESEASEEVEFTVPADPKPYDLTARMTPAGVQLDWEKPDMNYANEVPVTMDFNGLTTAKIVDDPDHPGFKSLDIWAAIERGSGTRYNTSYQKDGLPWYISSYILRSYGYTDNVATDDWLISEELNGNHQDVSLVAYSGASRTGTNTCQFAIYYTTSADRYDLDSYVKAADFTADSETETYSARLPFGARYFALVNRNAGSSYLAVESLTYTPAREVEAPAPADAPARVIASFEGYNIYRDGQKINAELVGAEQYVDTDIKTGDTHTYKVTAVYASKETDATDEVSFTVPEPNAPHSLLAHQNGDGVQLDWGAAGVVYPRNTTRFTETFDEASTSFRALPGRDDAWTVMEGRWTTRMGGSTATRTYTSQGRAWTFSTATIGGTEGNNIFTTAYRSGEDLDDWLISEELNGARQSIEFKYWATSGHDVRFEVLYTDSDDILNPDVWTVAVEKFCSRTSTLKTLSVDIPEGSRHFAIHATSPAGSSYLRLDDISYIPARIVAVDTPAEEEEETPAAVAPLRAEAAASTLYKVYRNDELIATTTATTYVDTTAPVGQAVYKVTAETPAGESAPTAEVAVNVKGFVPPTGVVAMIGQEGINVMWESAGFDLRNTEPYTETFDDPTFDQGQHDGVGGWTFINRNGMGADAFGGGGQAMWDKAAFFISSWGKGASAGENDRALVSTDRAVSFDLPEGAPRTDNWAISPLLNGTAQTITLNMWEGYGAGSISVELLYSTTDMNPESFQLIEALNVVKDKSLRSFSLPEGARYFAIRNLGAGTLNPYLLIDNITYIPALAHGTHPDTPVLAGGGVVSALGYNVYVNGEAAHTDMLTDLSHLHMPGGAGDFEFTVESVFAGGKSTPSEPTKVSITSDMIDLPAPESLAGTAVTEEGVAHIDLTWAEGSAPLTPIYSTESFESYAVGSAPGAPWTLVHADGGDHGSAQGELAWFVTDAKRHTGTKAIRCNSSSASGGNDDWIISPELCGLAQTLSFWATCHDWASGENYEVLVSSTDSELTSFTVIKSEKIMYNNWREITCQLPEGTRYVAIRCTSVSKFGLYIDDLTYSTSTTLRGSLLGYNIYRLVQPDEENQPQNVASLSMLPGAEKINSEPLAEPSFSDTGLENEGRYNYVVTGVYPWGESEASDPHSVQVVLTGIDNVLVGAGRPDVRYYTIQGVEVANPAPGQVYLEVGSDGTARKVLVK